MSDQEVIGWLALRQLPGVSDLILIRLMERFGSSQEIFSVCPETLVQKTGLPRPLAESISKCSTRSHAQEELKRICDLGASVMTSRDPAYPRLLAAISHPPPILTVRGTLQPGDQQALAVVGLRRASAYGLRLAEKMSRDLAACGLTIVSGLARGIDTAAHRGALAAGGRTLAVMGSGLDICYPPENKKLYDEIARQGAILSEFPPGTPPLPTHFPRRNRIISGLSLGTLVVEAAERSGSLITARCALEQGREVFAIPGNVGSPPSEGTNRLIQAGAKLVREIPDILEEIAPQIEALPPTDHLARPPRGSREYQLYEILSDEPCHIDDLIFRSRLSPADVNGILLQLELQGTAKQLGGQHYVRTG